MAYSDKDIVITPNKGSSTLRPNIRLTDGLSASSSTISLGVETISGRAALTVDGVEGRLLTIIDSFTGTIFAITDSVGVPMLAADNTGTVVIGQYKGTLDVRSTATINRLITGIISTTTDLLLQTSNNTRFQIGSAGQLGIGGANYGSTGSVFISNGPTSAPAWSTTGNTGSVFVSNGPNAAPSWTTSIGTSTSTITLAGPVSFNRSFNEIVASPAISAGTLSLDLSTAGIFDITLNGNISTITITNPISSGRASSFIVILNYQSVIYTVTWPASFRWPGGTAPVLTNSNGKRDIFTIFTTDGGTTYNAFSSGQNL